VVGFDLLRRDRDLGVLLVGLEDGLGESDILSDAFEQLLLTLVGVAVGILPKIPGRQDVVVGVARQPLFDRVTGGAFDRQFQLVGGKLRAAHSSALCGASAFRMVVLVWWRICVLLSEDGTVVPMAPS